MKGTDRQKVKEWKKIFHANGNERKTGVAILLSDKIDLKSKAITRDKEGHYIMIKGAIQQEDIHFSNMYAPNIGALKNVKQIVMDIKGEIDNNTVRTGDFNMTLTSIDSSSRQKINKEAVTLNNTLDQMDLIDIFRAFHFKAAKYTYFSSAHGTCYKKNKIPRNKPNQGCERPVLRKL